MKLLLVGITSLFLIWWPSDTLDEDWVQDAEYELRDIKYELERCQDEIYSLEQRIIDLESLLEDIRYKKY